MNTTQDTRQTTQDTKTTHTPGPWQAFGCAIYTTGRSYGKDVFIASSFLDLTGDRMPSDVEIENARLIAAAPELLAALQRAEERLRAANSERTEAQGHFMISDIKSAIAKAKGQA